MTLSVLSTLKPTGTDRYAEIKEPGFSKYRLTLHRTARGGDTGPSVMQAQKKTGPAALTLHPAYLFKNRHRIIRNK